MLPLPVGIFTDCLSFPTAQWLDSNSKGLKERSKCAWHFYDLPLEITYHPSALLFETVTKFHPVSKGGDRESTSGWGSDKVLEEYLK